MALCLKVKTKQTGQFSMSQCIHRPLSHVGHFGPLAMDNNGTKTLLCSNYLWDATLLKKTNQINPTNSFAAIYSSTNIKNLYSNK